MNQWGQTLSIDLQECNYSLLINKKKLKEFPKSLCSKIDMVPYGRTIIKKFGSGNLEGYSIFQFIKTSSITVHLDEFGLRAFIDIFSCKKFDVDKATNFCKDFFGAGKIEYKNFYRG